MTLTVAAAAVIKGQLDRLHGGAVIGLLAGLIASLLAAIFALVASIDHQPYKVTSPDMLERLCTDDWADSEVTASNRVARSKITAIRTLRNGTKVRMIWLEWAYGVQILAIVSLAATFVSIVLQK
ncbi:MAG: hypothetical protein LBQ06_06750 [Frankiaceae bacterium]|nr:hypothetical protein [Frankiaceae bacterium]